MCVCEFEPLVVIFYPITVCLDSFVFHFINFYSRFPSNLCVCMCVGGDGRALSRSLIDHCRVLPIYMFALRAFLPNSSITTERMLRYSHSPIGQRVLGSISFNRALTTECSTKWM